MKLKPDVLFHLNRSGWHTMDSGRVLAGDRLSIIQKGKRDSEHIRKGGEGIAAFMLSVLLFHGFYDCLDDVKEGRVGLHKEFLILSYINDILFSVNFSSAREPFEVKLRIGSRFELVQNVVERKRF